MESQDANGVVNKSFMMLFAFLQERMIHMVLSNAYNYINVLDKAADASWVRNDVLANNIANAGAPNYKRKDVQFETYLSNAVAGTDSLDETVANIDLSTLESTTYTEQAGLSYREDGNNVDISTENVELAKNQLKYLYADEFCESGIWPVEVSDEDHLKIKSE